MFPVGGFLEKRRWNAHSGEVSAIQGCAELNVFLTGGQDAVIKVSWVMVVFWMVLIWAPEA
jgi:hypothetical protein